MTTTFPLTFTFPFRTSCEFTTHARSAPGIPGIKGSAPIALNTVCGLISAISSFVTGVFRRISAPRRSAFLPIAITASFISAFLGASPAVKNCPPTLSDASHMMALCPRCRRIIAASSPAIPPPAINTVSGFSVLVILHSASLPTAGFLRQVICGQFSSANPSRHP